MPRNTKLRNQYIDGRTAAELTVPKPFLEEDDLIDGDRLADTTARWDKLDDNTFLVRIPPEDASVDSLPNLGECEAIRKVAAQMILESDSSSLSLTPTAD